MTDQKLDLSSLVDNLTLDDLDFIETTTGVSFADIDTLTTAAALKVAGYIVHRIRDHDASPEEIWTAAGRMTMREVMEAVDEIDPPQPVEDGNAS